MNEGVICDWIIENCQEYGYSYVLDEEENIMITRLYLLYLQEMCKKYHFPIEEDNTSPMSLFLRREDALDEFPLFLSDINIYMGQMINFFAESYGMLLFYCDVDEYNDQDALTLKEYVLKKNPNLKKYEQMLNELDSLEIYVNYIEYGEILLLIDPDYSLKKDCFLMRNSKEELIQLERYFNKSHLAALSDGNVINGITEDGEAYHIILMGSDGSLYSGVEAFNPNFIEAKMEFKRKAGF